MSPIQTAMINQRKKIILCLGFIFCGLWLLLIGYILTCDKQAQPVAPAAQVTDQAPSPAGMESRPAAPFHSSHRATSLIHHSASEPNWSYDQSAPKATMRSTSMRIYQTSSAKVHSVGGGSGGRGGSYTSNSGNSGKGIRTSSPISYGGNLLALSASTSLASPGAREAMSIATTTVSSSQEASSSPRRLPGHEEEWWLNETPVGDVAWEWMILLVAVYATMCGVRRFRREER